MAATLETSAKDQVIEAFSKLSKGMQLEAFLKIRDLMSVEMEEELEPLTTEQSRELDARSEQMRRDPSASITFEEFEKELVERFGKDL